MAKYRKEKMSHKQLDKWTVFNCEYCGKEKEELTTHYKKAKHHFCSYNCVYKFKKECHLLVSNNQE